jgi:hypothetical protein
MVLEESDMRLLRLVHKDLLGRRMSLRFLRSSPSGAIGPMSAYLRDLPVSFRAFRDPRSDLSGSDLHAVGAQPHAFRVPSEKSPGAPEEI